MGESTAFVAGIPLSGRCDDDYILTVHWLTNSFKACVRLCWYSVYTQFTCHSKLETEPAGDLAGEKGSPAPPEIGGGQHPDL